MSRKCIEFTIWVAFDAPSIAQAERKIRVPVVICYARLEDLKLDDIVDKVLDELAYEFQRATKMTKDVVESYKDALRPYIEGYISSILSNMLSRTYEEVEKCVEEEIELEEEDGYHEERTGRAIWVRIETTIDCRRPDEIIDALEHITMGIPVDRDVFRRYYNMLPDDKKMIILPLTLFKAPHELVLELMQKHHRSRWWYTVYYTENK